MSSLAIHRVAFQNFLSVGNELVEIDFTQHASTLIIGENGAGKSLLIDAIMYGLYGRPFRRVNVPQLINSVTERDMLVRVELTANEKNVVIVRGLKPRIFTIEINGQKIEELPDSRQQQDWLETHVLCMSSRTFQHVAILGAANFTPFMQLASHHRRALIEDLLDISIFSKMTDVRNSLATENRLEIERAESLVRESQAAQEYIRRTLSVIKENERRVSDDTAAAEAASRVSELETKLAALESSMKKHEEEIILPAQSRIQQFRAKINDIIGIISTLKNKITQAQKRRTFLLENDTCPTCKQEINADFKNDILQKCDHNVSEYEAALEDLSTRRREVEEKISALNTAGADRAATLRAQIEQTRHDLTSARAALNALQNKRLPDVLAVTEPTLNNDLEAAAQREAAATSKREDLLLTQEALNWIGYLLRDSGVKAQLIKKYIKVINQLINAYLARLEFMCDFEFDENFQEKILSRGRDQFTYFSFSEGEKARLDLAMIFAWRDLARLRHSASVNLLILDEVFDGSADGAAQELLIEILATESQRSHVVVISHRSDSYYDRFQRVLEISKDGNFTKIRHA